MIGRLAAALSALALMATPALAQIIIAPKNLPRSPGLSSYDGIFCEQGNSPLTMVTRLCTVQQVLSTLTAAQVQSALPVVTRYDSGQGLHNIGISWTGSRFNFNVDNGVQVYQPLLGLNNLTDVASIPQTRINLGLGTAATYDASAFDPAGAASNASNLTTGTISSARLPTVQSSPGTYGSGTAAPVITVDAQGRITSISTAAITGAGGGGSTTTDASQLTAGTLNAARLPGTTGDATAPSGSNVLIFSGTQQSRINLGFAFVSSQVSAPAAIPTGSSIYVTVPLSGATVGDFAQCSLSVDQQGLILSGYVPSNGNVRCTYLNFTGASVSLAAHTVYVQAERHS